MSNKWGWGTLLVAAIGFTVILDAQQPGGGRRGGGGLFSRSGMVSLAGAEAVQKELALEAEAKDKIGAISEEYIGEIREQMQTAGAAGFQNASDDERQKMLAKLQEISQKLNAKYVPKIKEVLKPEQFSRLQQITWQAGGAAAFSDPDLAKALNLSTEQVEKIAAISQDYQQKQRGVFSGGNIQEAMAKLRELSQERDQKAEQVLSSEQQSKYKELKGKPFDLAQLRPGPRGN